jgi:hypothetical protein
MTDKIQYDQTLEQFLAYLFGILQIYRNAVPILKAELDAIMEDDIETLNESLKSQQALLLRTRNFDDHAADFLSGLGINAENLTEAARQLPEGDGLRFFDLLGEFELIMTEVLVERQKKAILGYAAEVNYYKDKCRALLQSKLYMIDKTLSKLVIQKDNTTYDQNASEIHGTLFPGSFETKI